MTFPRVRPRTRAVAAVLPLLLLACREGTGNASGTGGSSGTPVPPALFGANGCNGADLSFTPPPPPVPVPLSPATAALIGPRSRIAADIDEERLYLTGTNATIVELEFTGGVLTQESVLVSGGVIQSLLLDALGIVGPADLSGIAVLDDDSVVVMEHASNTLLLATRGVPDAVFFFLGQPSATPGFADGPGILARFHFLEPGGIAPTGDGRVFLADTGNHRIRVAAPDGAGGFLVSTAAGSGIGASIDGGLLVASFDTPEGLTVSCQNELLVTERGTSGGGNLLRSVIFTVDLLFGFADVDVTTLAGDGTQSTGEGIGGAASLARPSPIVSTSQGDVYWVDTQTGVLRRYRFSDGNADCPLAPDCPSAVAAPSFSAGGGDFSLALSSNGELFVLDTGAALLYRIP